MTKSKHIIVQQPLVFTSYGNVFAKSQQIATHFEKLHDHVLRDIDGLLNSGETPRQYFHLTSYIESQNGPEYRCYNMTRDGSANSPWKSGS
jgi:phage regulator Rha-like protein